MRSGIESELARVYGEHAAPLLRYARTLTTDPEEARDAVQEAFLRYCKERHYGRRIENPQAWLFQVTRNHLLSRMTSAAARSEVSSETLDSMAGADGDPETMAARVERAQAIRKRLTQRELACLQLRVQGLSYEEIGELLHIRSGTVGALLARVSGKLRWPPGEDGAIDIGIAEAVHCLFLGDWTWAAPTSTR